MGPNIGILSASHWQACLEDQPNSEVVFQHRKMVLGCKPLTSSVYYQKISPCSRHLFPFLRSFPFQLPLQSEPPLSLPSPVSWLLSLSSEPQPSSHLTVHVTQSFNICDICFKTKEKKTPKILKCVVALSSPARTSLLWEKTERIGSFQCGKEKTWGSRHPISAYKYWKGGWDQSFFIGAQWQNKG